MQIYNNYWTRLIKARDTDKSRHFAKTEFNNYFIIRSLNLFCALTITFGNWEPRPFISCCRTDQGNNFAFDTTSRAEPVFIPFCFFQILPKYMLRNHCCLLCIPAVFCSGLADKNKPLFDNSGKRAAVFYGSGHNYAWEDYYWQQNHCCTLIPHGRQTQKCNATSGFRHLLLRVSLKRKPARLFKFVEKCYKNSTGRDNNKLGVSEDVQ